jgi:hypothetical protein
MPSLENIPATTASSSAAAAAADAAAAAAAAAAVSAEEIEGNTDVMEGNTNVVVGEDWGSNAEAPSTGVVSVWDSEIANNQPPLPIGSVNFNDSADEEEDNDDESFLSNVSSMMTSIPLLTQRDLLNSSYDSESSMPPLIPRDQLSSSSDSESSMPLMRLAVRHGARADSAFLNRSMREIVTALKSRAIH